MLTDAQIHAERAAVVAEAKTFLGTPFHHAARIKGVGVDCAQLLLAVYGEARIIEPFDVSGYSRDWFIHQTDERFLALVERVCVPADRMRGPEPGDVALFRYGRALSHGAIVTAWGPDGEGARLIHAYRGRGVVEDPCWPASEMGQRLAAVWTFPRWHAPASATFGNRLEPEHR